MGKVLFLRKGNVHTKPIPLPNGYTKLAYIQSSGTQYVDTGVPSKSTSGFFIDFQFVKINSDVTAVAGAFTWGGYINGFWAIGTNWSSESGSNIRKTFGTADLNRHTAEQNVNLGVFKFDGETVFSGLDFYDNQDKTFRLGCFNGGASYPTYGISSLKIFQCKFYDNGTLVRDFLPCINASGAVGLYDLVGRQFYGNSGTGVFTGSEVE